MTWTRLDERQLPGGRAVLVHHAAARKFPYKVVVKVDGEKYESNHLTESAGRAALYSDWVRRMATMDPFDRMVLHIHRSSGVSQGQAETLARKLRHSHQERLKQREKQRSRR